MGKLNDLLQRIAENKRIEQERQQAENKAGSDKAAPAQVQASSPTSQPTPASASQPAPASVSAPSSASANAAQNMTADQAARADLAVCSSRLMALKREHDAAYQAAIAAKAAYMESLAALGKLERLAVPIQTEAWHLSRKIVGEEPKIITVGNDILHVQHNEPTAYISRSQIMAAYQGRNWKSVQPVE